MAEKLGEILEEEYTTKCLADNTIKVNCGMPDNYRKLTTFLNGNKVIYHTYQLKEALNRATNQLKIKIKEENDRSFHNYITGLKRFDNTIWKPLQYRKKLQQQVPPIRHEMASTPKWARSDEEKSTLFAEHLAKVFTLNDTETDPEVEEHLAHVPADMPEIKKKSPYR
jgi:hypothetical protein